MLHDVKVTRRLMNWFMLSKLEHLIAMIFINRLIVKFGD